MFSSMSPLFAGSALVMLIAFVTMLATSGLTSWRSMLARKYLWYSIPAFFYTAVLVLQFTALKLVIPSIMTALMQTATITTALMQYAIFGRRPHYVQTAALLATNMLAASYTLGNNTSAATVSIVGVVMSLGAASSRAPYGLSMEYVFSKLRHGAKNGPAESLRGLIAIEFWKTLFFVVLLFTYDRRFVLENGIFRGWDWNFFLGGLCPVALINLVQAIIFESCGALRTNLAATLEIFVVYMLEIVVLQTGDFILSKMLLALSLFMVVVTYNLCAIDVSRAEARVRLSMIDAVRSSQSSLTDAVRTASRQHVPDVEDGKPPELDVFMTCAVEAGTQTSSRESL